MELNLRGKVVIVTGATANIGRAIALEFGAEGAKVVAVGRDEEAGNRVVALAKERGADQAIFVPADLLDRQSPGCILDAATKLGPVSVLVNNVGGNVGGGLFIDSNPDSWQADIDLNVLTTLRMTHAILPGMMAMRAGRIINIGSTAGVVGDYMLSIYSAAKAAVHGFTRVLAREVGEYGITVNCVAPYSTLAEDPAAFSRGSRFHPDSGFYERAFPNRTPEEMAKMLRKSVVGRRRAWPEEIAAATVYFASNRAEFVTGQIFQVDGGTHL